MSKQITREYLQKTALDFSDTYKYLLLEWATRVGKTPAAIGIIKRNPGRWNIVVAETIHIHQWKEEFRKFHGENLLKYINIFCYQSLHKHRADDGINWIFDEAHHMFSDKRWKIISTFTSIPHAVFLTATLTDVQRIKLRQHFTPLAQHRFNLKDAIKHKILPQPKIYIIPLSLQTILRPHLWHMRKGKQINANGIICDYPNRWLHYFNSGNENLLLHIRCNEVEYYSLLNKDYEYHKSRYEKEKTEWYKTAWLKKGMERKRFLTSLKTKTVAKVVKHLGDKRFVCFAGSVKQGIELGGNKTVHSSNSTLENQKILDSFNDKKINQIFAIGMLQEGINLKNIDASIIVQLDSKIRTFVQKSGRTLLAHTPEQYIIYIKNTRDEHYLNSAMKEVDQKYVYTVNSMDELIK